MVPLDFIIDDEYDSDAEEVELEELEHVVVDNGATARMECLPAGPLSHYTRFLIDSAPRRRLSVYSITGYAADHEADEVNSGRLVCPSPPSYRSRNASDEMVGIAVTAADVDGGYSTREDRGAGHCAAIQRYRVDGTCRPLEGENYATGRSLTDSRSVRAKKEPVREDDAPEHLHVSSSEEASDPMLTPSTESEDEREGEKESRGAAVPHDASGSQKETLGPLSGVVVASGRSDTDRRYTWSSGGLRQRWTIAHPDRARRSI